MRDLPALLRRFDETMAAKDAAAVAHMSPEDVQYRDHRPLGWEPVDGRERLEAHYRSVLDAAESFRVETELLAERGDRVLVRQTSTFRARDDAGGGEGAIVMAVLVTIRDGLFSRIEIFDDEAAARAALAAGP